MVLLFNTVYIQTLTREASESDAVGVLNPGCGYEG